MADGLKILFNTYWDSKGWKDGTVSEEDFNLAKSQGYMFDYPNVMSHDDTLKKLKNIVKQVNPRDVANAFLYSLTTRKLEYRSAFGSYWYAISIPNHQLYLRNNSLNHNHCYLCGWNKWADNPTDYDLKHGINVYNFERYKFGGVRHTRLDYALFDLEQFLKLPKVTPTKEDFDILIKILKCIEKVNSKNKVGKLRDVIIKEKVFKTNKAEVSILLNLLGISGVLSNKDFPSYEEYFANEYERGPVESKNDFDYPVNRWYAKDGINEERFKKVFGFDYK